MFDGVREFLRPKYLIDCYYKPGGIYLSRGEERFHTLGGAERYADTMNRSNRWMTYVYHREDHFHYSAGHEDKEPGSPL